MKKVETITGHITENNGRYYVASSYGVFPMTSRMEDKVSDLGVEVCAVVLNRIVISFNPL